MRTHQGIACVRPRNSDGLVALLFGSFLPLHRSPISVSTCRTSASLSVMSYVVRCGGRHYTTQHRNFLLSRERSGVSRIAVTQRCAWNSVQGSRAPVRFVLVDEVFKNIGHAKRRDRPRIETRKNLSHGLAYCSDQILSVALPRKPRENGWRRCLLQLPEEVRLTTNPREGRCKRIGIPWRNQKPIYLCVNHEGNAAYRGPHNRCSRH